MYYSIYSIPYTYILFHMFYSIYIYIHNIQIYVNRIVIISNRRDPLIYSRGTSAWSAADVARPSAAATAGTAEW